MNAAILVLDYGTTALKAVAYDERFRRLKTVSREWKYLYPMPNCIEYPAEAYWQQTLSAVAELRKGIGDFWEIKVISVTGQSETMILLDAKGLPVGNAIVWLDGRAVEECVAAKRAFDESRLYAITGNPDFNVNMPLLKIQWLQERQHEQYAKMDKLLLLKDYIVYRLTGSIVSEHTVNCCSGYFDINRRDWADELLELCGLRRKNLPELAGSRAVVGSVCPEAASAMEVKGDVKVVNGLLDQCASAVGAGNLFNGMICETTGTVLAIAATLDEFRPEKMMRPVLMFCHAREGKYLALPNCPTAGVLLTWFKNNFLAVDEGGFDRINEEVWRRLDKDSELVLLPHFGGRLSPVVNGNARGVLYGLTLNCDKFDIARSIMESVAYMLRENLALLGFVDLKTSDMVSLGGASKSSVWQQIKADVCRRNIVSLTDDESTALGCAFNAGIALGMLEEKDIPTLIQIRDTYIPNQDRGERYDRKYATYLDLNHRLGYDETL